MSVTGPLPTRSASTAKWAAMVVLPDPPLRAASANACTISIVRNYAASCQRIYVTMHVRTIEIILSSSRPFERHQPHAYRESKAYRLCPRVPHRRVPTENGTRLGPIVSIPKGARLESCGFGFNERTIKARCQDRFYFIFLRDLEDVEPATAGVVHIEALGN
jgi:hypothetical protein